MEVAMVADDSVIAHHGRENIHMYLVTLLNVVDQLYNHETLGISMRIILSEIILLSRSHNVSF